MNNETTTAVETKTAQRGRPVVEGSARQQKLAAMAERIAAGQEIKRGRPSNPNSNRQARLKAQADRVAAGFILKPGRPSTKAQTVTELMSDVEI